MQFQTETVGVASYGFQHAGSGAELTGSLFRSRLSRTTRLEAATPDVSEDLL